MGAVQLVNDPASTDSHDACTAWQCGRVEGQRTPKAQEGADWQSTKAASWAAELMTLLRRFLTLLGSLSGRFPSRRQHREGESETRTRTRITHRRARAARRGNSKQDSRTSTSSDQDCHVGDGKGGATLAANGTRGKESETEAGRFEAGVGSTDQFLQSLTADVPVVKAAVFVDQAACQNIEDPGVAVTGRVGQGSKPAQDEKLRSVLREDDDLFSEQNGQRMMCVQSSSGGSTMCQETGQ